MYSRLSNNSLHSEAKIITTRIALSVEEVSTGYEKYKALLAAHGDKDRKKEGKVPKSPTILPISLRLLLTAAAIKKYVSPT